MAIQTQGKRIPQVKLINLHRQYLSIKEEIDNAIQLVLDSTDFIMGSAVHEFEAQLSQHLGVRFVVGCASGTDALQIAMMAVGVAPGDEVITAAFSFAATSETILLLGARPVYVDIDPRTYNIDVQQISKKISPKTKAIIPVHLYGQPAEMKPILDLAKETGLKVIEDAAQAIGARYEEKSVGTHGDLGCLSFYPTKNLGAYGDAGAILTNDAQLAEKCRMISVHGSRVKYQHEVLGINSRLDTLQAAILKVKLKHLERWTTSRIQVAKRYNEALQGLDLVTPYCLPNVRHVYHQYSILTPRRNELAQFLADRGVASTIHYPAPLHLQTAFKRFVKPEARYPVAEAVSQKVLCLPIYPEMEEAEINAVTSTIQEFFKNLLNDTFSK